MHTSNIAAAVTSAALLATLAVSAREPVPPTEIINSFAETFAVHPEPRLQDHNCICATGEFVGTSAASALSRSAMFTQDSVPVVARFSATHGNPNSRNSREMELEFRIAGGGLQHMAMLNTPVFGTSDAVTFAQLIVALKPDPDTGTVDMQRLHDFLTVHPAALAQSNFLTAADGASSYASSVYFSIHTFRFIDATGRTRFVRWRFLPQDGDTTVPASEAGRNTQDTLQERFIKRLAVGPIRWDMIVYVGQRGDTIDNPSIAWPEDERTHLKAGTLIITQVVPESAAGCAKMNFDPLVVSDGIAPADDPVLLLRSPAYGRAFFQILAQVLAPADAAHVAAQ